MITKEIIDLKDEQGEAKRMKVVFGLALQAITLVFLRPDKPLPSQKRV